jgi:hypothetical protein
VTDIKRVEFKTVGGCKSCDVALNELLPIAKERSVPVHVLPIGKGDTFVPMTCVVKEINGEESEVCVKGWDKDYEEDMRDLLDG